MWFVSRSLVDSRVVLFWYNREAMRRDTPRARFRTLAWERHFRTLKKYRRLSLPHFMVWDKSGHCCVLSWLWASSHAGVPSHTPVLDRWCRHTHLRSRECVLFNVDIILMLGFWGIMHQKWNVWLHIFCWKWMRTLVQLYKY